MASANTQTSVDSDWPGFDWRGGPSADEPAEANQRMTGFATTARVVRHKGDTANRPLTATAHLPPRPPASNLRDY